MSIAGMVACLLVALGAATAKAQQVGVDRQAIQVGNGLANKDCIGAGSNNMIESTVVGDDVSLGVSTPIHTGPNGICDTPLGGDDVYLPGFTLGGGKPFQSVIVAGTAGSNNGICDKITVAGGDDVVEAAAGKSTPRQVGIQRGANATIDSTPAGDDVVTSVICAGPNSNIDSTPAGDDVNVTSDVRCNDAGCGGFSCIIPGVNDVLETTLAADDVARSYISTGANGILDTTKAGDDQIPSNIWNDPPGTPGGGTRSATCVNSGANGIAETSLCGTGGTLDIAVDGNPEACDTAGESATCDDDCTLVSCGDGNANGAAGEACDDGGESATCDANCTLVACGDGTENNAAGETCDDGNVLSNDGCNSTCQVEFCGDGIIQSGLGEVCDTSGESASCDDDCTLVSCGDGNANQAAGETCDDGNVVSNDGCNAVCGLEFCGDGIIQSGIGEVCDDGGGNSDTTPDACRTTCQLPSCGDGVTDPSNSEQCDDGNVKNNDDCLVQLGCLDAVCGDGFRQTKGTPPFEECDDGNTSPGDGCDGDCVLEPNAGCQNGIQETLCTAGTIGASCSVNADCDVTLGDGVCTAEECDDGNNSSKDDCLNNCVDASCGDGIEKTRGTPPFEECDDGNNQPGDGCGATCLSECGNGQIDGACSQGTVGAFCQTNADCDVTLGDGVCVTEECDTAIDGLCLLTPPTCSAECTIASCGNGEQECDEQCDLGGDNGVLGSGCTIACARNVIGKKELTGQRECPGAWTMDSPPQDTQYHFQHCKDGAACDFDGLANGECRFSVGICLNRGQPANCQQSAVVAVDLLGLHTERIVHANAADALTTALFDLDPPDAEAPPRCIAGKPRKNCTNDVDCDSYLGADDGICGVPTGVSYAPAFVPTGCTPGQPIVVPAGESLRLRMFVRRDPVKGDKDSLRLLCED